MSSVCPAISECVAFTSGERMPFRVPSTSVGKNRMQIPMAKGRIKGKRSMGSAWASDCQTRKAM